MNVHKHMEAIFVVTLVVVTSGTLVFDSLREADEAAVASAASAAPDARTVVVRAPTPSKQA